MLEREGERVPKARWRLGGCVLDDWTNGWVGSGGLDCDLGWDGMGVWGGNLGYWDGKGGGEAALRDEVVFRGVILR